MVRPRPSLGSLARGGLGALLLGAGALLCAPPAAAEEPLAEISGLPDGPVLDLVRSTVGTEEDPPESVFEARRRAERARERAVAALRSEGYYGARVETRVDPGDPPVARLEITPGEQFVVGRVAVEVSGSTDSPAAQAAAKAAALAPGAPARAGDVIAAETRAVAAVEAEGFPDVQAMVRQITVDHATGRMDVTLRIDSGRAVVLGTVEATGAARIRRGYLLRLAPFRPGDAYDRRALDTLAGRLRETGAYESVSVTLAESGPDPGPGPERRDVIVDLQPGPRRSIALGALYSTSEGAGVEGSWTLRNVFAAAESLTATASLREIEQNISVELSAPHWRRPGRTLRLNTALTGEETDAYDRRAVEAGARVEQRLGERSSTAIGTGISFAEVDEGGESQEFTLVFASGSIALDRSDDALDPRRGFRASASARPTVGVGDDPVGYVVVEGAATAYHSIGERVTGALRGRFGDILGPALAEVPANERFYAGGGGSIRGYEYQSVSPRNAEGVIVGGRSLVEVSAEVRYRTSARVGYVAFVDGGAASDGLTPETSELRWGAGVGVTYRTRIGPIRGDIATPLDRRPGEPAVQLYIQIGQAF